MSTMRRRTFLQTTTAGAALAALPGRAAEPLGRRPNFLFIVTDDQRWDCLGVVQREQGERARFPWLQTPHLDRLAAEGARFRNAFVVNSLCAPSRATFLTGCYGHVNGIVNNHTPFSPDNVTHASLLRQAGYRTGYVGKWHMGNQSGQRPGFDWSASYVGQGVYVDCPFEINGQKTPTKGWIDDVATDFALQFIRAHQQEPFSLCVGYKSSHGPFTPPDRAANLYADEQARSTPNFAVPAIYRPEAKPPTEPVPEKVKCNLGHFRCLTAMDENVGKLLKALDDLGLAEDTVVVFAGDNGYYHGEHGLGDKRSAYDESLRIPLLMRYPRLAKAGSTVDQMTLNIDLAPTILDLAGVPAPATMQGRSWRPLLTGAAADWRHSYFYCYFFEQGFAGIPTTTAVRTETAKLIKYPGHPEWTEVFDLAHDPYETRNLAADPAAADLRRTLETEYDRQAKLVGWHVPSYADDPAKEAAAPGGKPLNAWVLDYRFDQDQAAEVRDASGKGNHGTATGAPLVAGREGRRARQFDGQGYIEVPRSKSLDPSVAGWTVEVTCQAGQPTGVILARGGQTLGYCLWLDAGRPAFQVNSTGGSWKVVAKDPVGAEWVTIAARITADRRLVLLVNGQPAAQAKLGAFIERDPTEAMQIGVDGATRVVKEPVLPGFTGLIERVRIHSGEAP